MERINDDMTLSFPAKSVNESFARVCVAAFAARLDPTVADIEELKTAVSEAVTNAVIHGYEEKDGYITVRCRLDCGLITVEVSDEGRGISDIEKAREPLFTTRPEMERSGMGFTVMETFMDEVEVESSPGFGTKITMRKNLRK